MKNIIVLADFPPVIGGTTIWYYRISELLLERGYRVYTLGGKGTPPPGTIGLNPARTGAAAVRMARFIVDAAVEGYRQRAGLMQVLASGAVRSTGDWAKLISYLVLIGRAAKTIPAEPGVVLASHANMNSILGHLLCRRHGMLKLVIRSHGACVLELAERNPALVRFVLKQASAVNCVSEFIAATAIKRGAAPEKVSVIFSARDIPETHRAAPKEDVVLFCGFLDPRKDPMTFARAAKELVAAGTIPHARYVMIGSGTLEDALRKYCRDSGLDKVMTFTGALPLGQVWDWMARSKVLVLPSIREPSGAVLTEALAHRCYCIAARVGGIPELITAERGELFEPGDYRALAAAIAAFFGNEAAYRGKIEAAYAYVRDNYTFERAVDKLEASFKALP